ncbi:Putative rRNA methylase [Desulfuromusa kysingii]|uniref:Putative rRNA methylase n=1 Tax=Desulfuromusa kysingii TaxID=37625 RepID=A0A1H3WRY7_9BACT|nr:class I SAM-dependent methyltransferase [Desulfuromusa kysingii]SDZ89903.1 Putative rRNA methylase [Desulfuromusa kysingii]
MKRALVRMVDWTHELLSEVVQAGDLAVDLTAGTGQDTLALYKMVGSAGQVIAFDIQPQAIAVTGERLTAAGARVRFQQQDNCPLPCEPGVDLLQISHVEISKALPKSPKGIIANLGYFPGGKKELVTRPESTLLALQQSCFLLAVGGRLALAVYPGYPGGAEEGAAVDTFLAELDDSIFHVLQMKVSNRLQAPFLFIVEKRI